MSNALVDIRIEIVEEAKTWLGTPYIKRGKIKGVGVDCGLLPYMVYKKFDLVPDLGNSLPTLEDGWFCNTYDQRYARMVERYWRRLIITQARYAMRPEFLPGNLVLLKGFGSLVFNHAGIIIDWPRVIHSAPDTGVAKVDASTDPFWACQEIAVYEVLGNDR